MNIGFEDVSPELVDRATAIVDNAIEKKGEVASLRSSHGNIKSFEDTLATGIWEGYLSTAMRFVDAGEWNDAHQRARNREIGRTISTLINQA